LNLNQNVLQFDRGLKITFFILFSFLGDIARIEQAEYLPTDQDILRVRVATTDIHEYPFNLDGLQIRYLFSNAIVECLDYHIPITQLTNFTHYNLNGGTRLK